MSLSELTPGPLFSTAEGIPVFHEYSSALPLVDIDIIVKAGARFDPEGQEGLTYLMTRLMRRGVNALDAEQFDNAIESMGATLAISVRHEQVRLHGAVLKRNVDKYLKLITEMLLRPAFREDEFARLVRETHSDLVRLRDSDRSLSFRAFRRYLFKGHPYGRTVLGDASSIDRISLEDVRRQHGRLIRASELLIGFAGDISTDEIRRSMDGLFTEIRDGQIPREPCQTPELKSRLIVVEKPERTQAQLLIGTLGIAVGSEDYHALLVANTAFGGTFTSRLVHEVRSERGWSYSVGSKFAADHDREAWTMSSQPAIAQLPECLSLQLALYRDWVGDGLEAFEIERARDYLVKSHAFDCDTASKRLEPQLEAAVYGLQRDWHPRHTEYVRSVDQARANQAVSGLLMDAPLTIVVMASKDDRLVADLEARSSTEETLRIPYDLRESSHVSKE